MKKIAFATAALLTAFSMGTTTLEAQRAIGVNLGAGPSIGIGDDKGTGFHVNAGVGFAPAMLPVGLRLEGMFQRLPEGDDHHNYLSGSLNAEVGLPLAVIRPYAIGGIGLVRHEEIHGDHGHGAHTDFAFNVGLGTNFGLMGRSAYIEARYFRLGGGDDHGHGHGHGHDDHTGNTFIPITIGIRF
jgi:hypothetical protein